MTEQMHEAATRRMQPRSHSNFATRTARDDAEQLDRRSSVIPASPSPNEETPLLSLDGVAANRQRGCGSGSEAHQERDHGIDSMRERFARAINTSPFRKNGEIGDHDGKHAAKPRPGAFPRPVGGTSKLGTFAGVFVPTTLNVLSILMFLRFGFILGQAGVIGMMGEFTPSCVQCSINLRT